MFVFRKIWRALFSWNTDFEIRPFALLPTIVSLDLSYLGYFLILFSWKDFLSQTSAILRRELPTAWSGSRKWLPVWFSQLHIIFTDNCLTTWNVLILENTLCGSRDRDLPYKICVCTNLFYYWVLLHASN